MPAWTYQWTSSGPVNVDAHGDPVNAPKGFYHGGKARQITSGDGVLQAAFEGKHGCSGEIVVLRPSRSSLIQPATT
jgi:hypothetical protein